MSRYNTQVLSSIRMLCRMQNIDEKVLYPPTVCRKWQECLGYIVRPFTISLPMKILSLSRLAGISELPKRALKNGITIRPATS